MAAGAGHQVEGMIKDLDRTLGFRVTENFLFEPTVHFYKKLERVEKILPLHEIYRRLDTNQTTWTTLEDAAKEIVTHLNRPDLGIGFARLDSLHAGLYHDTSRKIQISEDFRGKAFQLGTILAHEITHDFLYARGVWRQDTTENERYTEIAAIKLGLGKLYLNGMEEVGPGFSRKIGYLPVEDLAYAYVQVCRAHRCDSGKILQGLVPRIRGIVEPALVPERVQDGKEVVHAVRKRITCLEGLLSSAAAEYARVCENHQVFISRGRDIDVNPEDAGVIVEITNKLQFEEYRPELAGMRREVESFEDQIAGYQFANDIQVIEWQILQLGEMQEAIRRCTVRIEAVTRVLQGWLDVQESYLVGEAAITKLEKDLSEVWSISRRINRVVENLKDEYRRTVHRQELLKARRSTDRFTPADRESLDSLDRMIAAGTFEEILSSCGKRITDAVNELPDPDGISPRMVRDLGRRILTIRHDIAEITRISDEISVMSGVQIQYLAVSDIAREKIGRMWNGLAGSRRSR